MSAAAVIMLRRKRLIRRFREVGALDEQHAVIFDSLGERRSWTFNQMVNHRVFVQTADGRFYLDELAAEEFMRRCRWRALIVAAIFLLLFLVYLAAVGTC